jgi:hypothetical protein
MDFKAFSEFCEKNRAIMSLFEWIYAPPPPKSSEVNAPTFHETIARITNCAWAPCVFSGSFIHATLTTTCSHKH